MKTILLSLLFVLPFLLLAQKTTDQRVTFGIAQSHLHLYTTDHYETYSSTTRSTSIPSQIHHSRGVGFNLGYSRKIHPRWELSTRINYAGQEVQDTIRDYYRHPNTSFPDTRTRTYRAFWSEAMVFWRMVGDRSLADLQLGTGIAHLYYRQEYDSGYIFNLDYDLYDVKFYTVERKGSFGIPIHLQFQYPINYNWKIGFAAQVNSFFNGDQQSGVTAFAAYRW
jgi:hypothetical protein